MQATTENITAAAPFGITLAEGEIYVGSIGDENGKTNHVILLPGDNDDANWHEQTAWAKSIGGDLPTRIEQAMLWAKFRDQFKRDWYWSNEVHHNDSGWAWCQHFNNGNQHDGRQGLELRARAVRRLTI
ncbi:Conserved protein of unknown function [Ralstonia solanacearum CMR15]|nr:Conserved protein of unknown function [Ralstonia solanacearum CMR15]